MKPVQVSVQCKGKLINYLNVCIDLEAVGGGVDCFMSVLVTW